MNKHVRAIFFLPMVLLAWLALVKYKALATTKPVAKGTTFPSIQLLVPEDAAFRNYLGLSGSGKFTIPQIRARVVIVQVFSRY